MDSLNKICVLGLGYIGLPTASTFATHGVKVIGVDINPEIIKILNNGNVHIFEPGLNSLFHTAINSGKLIVKNGPEQADAFIIAVPTPFKENKLADLRHVVSAAEAIYPVLQEGNLVILESTSPPRTTVDIVAPILEKSGLKAGIGFHLAYSPERVLPGQILREIIENARVIGGINVESAQAGRELYRTFVTGEIFLTDATTAEMVKLMENTYRDVNIAIANEFSRLADRFSIDIWEAIQIANRHPRVEILKPGPGVGGHCISVDPWFLVEAAPDLTKVIAAARHVNDSQPEFVVNSVIKSFGDLEGKKFAVLGLTYKPDVDDLRESPAVEVVNLLIQSGAMVNIFEPFNTAFQVDGALTKTTIKEVIDDAEAILLLVGHAQLKEIDPNEFRRMSKATLAFDAVNGWQRNAWQDAGFTYIRIGDGKHKQ